MPLRGKAAVLKKYSERSDKFVRALALTGMTRLIEKTPVDTGRAKNNWNLAKGAPETTNLPAGDYSKSGSVAIVEAAGNAGKMQAGDTLYLTNGLPYIPPLENGHSKQAPAGMIGLTVAELRPWAAAEVRKLNRGD